MRSTADMRFAAATRIERPGDPLQGIGVLDRFDDAVLNVELQRPTLTVPAPGRPERVSRVRRAVGASPELETAVRTVDDVAVALGPATRGGPHGEIDAWIGKRGSRNTVDQHGAAVLQVHLRGAHVGADHDLVRILPR